MICDLGTMLFASVAVVCVAAVVWMQINKP